MSSEIVRSTEALLVRSECEQVLTNACHETHLRAELLDYCLEPAKDALGFLGDYYYLTLTYEAVQSKKCNDSGTKSTQQVKLFVKSLPKESADKESVSIFKKESQLYVNLLQKMQNYSPIRWCPTLHYARDGLLVLENLNTHAFKICQLGKDELDEHEMKQLLRGLAALHAASITYEVQNQLNIGLTYAEMLQEITISPQVRWYTTGLRAVLELAQVHPKYQSETMQKLLKNTLPQRLEAVHEMSNSSTKYRNVLCHRDPWFANVFLERESALVDAERSALFVDYQTCRYCPASIDVAFVMYMNLSSEKRKNSESYYLKWYYDNFTQLLARSGIEADAHLTLEQFCSSYHEFELFGCAYKALAQTILGVPKHYVTDEYKHVERTSKILLYMKESAEFRHCMEDCIEELVETVLKPL